MDVPCTISSEPDVGEAHPDNRSAFGGDDLSDISSHGLFVDDRVHRVVRPLAVAWRVAAQHAL